MNEAAVRTPPPAAPTDHLRKSARNAVILGGSLLGTWAVALVVRFPMPRMLGPEAFGHYGFLEGFAASLFVLAGLGVDTYVQKEVSARPGHEREFLGAVAVLRTILGVLLAAALALVLQLTDRSHLISTGLAFALGQYVLSMNATLSAVLQARMTVGRLALVNLASKAAWGVGVLVALWARAPLQVFALVLAGAEGLKLVWLVATTRAMGSFAFRVDWPAAGRVLRAGVPYFVNTVAYTLGTKLDVTLLEFVTSSEEVGFYGAASNLSTLALLLAPLLSWVMMPLLARTKAESIDAFDRVVRRTLEAVLALSSPLVVLLALGAPLVTRLAFGERFAPASAALAVLAPSLLLTYVATILATALLIQDRPWTVTWTNVATTASLPVLVVVFAPWVRSRIGLGGGALADACIFTLLEVVTVVRFVGVLGRRVWDPRLGRTLAVSACAALGAVAAHGIVNRFLAAGDGPLTPSRATVALLASAGTYALVALALRLARREDLAALRGLFRRGSRPT